jgi:hypothetical protein
MAIIIDDDDVVQFTLYILEELPRKGFVDDGPVGLNSDGGLVKVLFQQKMGGTTVRGISQIPAVSKAIAVAGLG